MANPRLPSVREILLTRRGVVFVDSGEPAPAHDMVRAVELELAEIGYVISTRLRDGLSRCSTTELREFRDFTLTTLTAHAGGDRHHEPLFRSFPEGVPADTGQLWWSKVLVHFLQSPDQPCLFCGHTATTQVLNPCRHVVCSHCFDGRNYSACPVCEHHVDKDSPFFLDSPKRRMPTETVLFKRLDRGDDLKLEANNLFVGLCSRLQGLSPTDREALVVVLREYRSLVLDWIPSNIPLRENVAVVFGTLFQECPADEVLPIARHHMTTATDVLRFIAVLSGTDGSLMRETVFRTVELTESSRYWEQIAKLLGAAPPQPGRRQLSIPIRVHRFKVAKIPRSLRRALLNLLEGMELNRLIEDMLRHQSYWVWVGEFLHPGEYAKRFPKVTEAFQVLRQKSADGTPAPRFETWNSRIEQSLNAKNIPAMLEMLNERPGEFARRFDLLVRVAHRYHQSTDDVVESFVRLIPSMATPVLLTLTSHLPTRTEPARIRVYWPKGRTATGVAAADKRDTLPSAAIAAAVRAIEGQLLERFARLPAFQRGVIDEQLRNVAVPFNERTASPAAISLPRGTRVQIPLEKTIRLFLHWCQPETDGGATDLDLSVALYDDTWKYVGVCSYYQLKLSSANGDLVAQSAGDLRDAPWPNGATEFVDLHCEPARQLGVRYAVMVVNSFSGLSFSQLDCGFAGLMLRSDPGGRQFDPRTVELRFALSGEHGVFMPLVVDLQDRCLHWLDVQSKGQLEMNNVETAKAAICRICPDLLTYFASGVRPTMYDLATLHAAARCQQVIVRGTSTKCFERNSGEGAAAFLSRLRASTAPTEASDLDFSGPPVFAALFRGDLELPEGSSIYALLREKVAPTLAASDLLSASPP